MGWCPLNETTQALTDRITNLDDTTRAMLLAARAIDRTRPVLDASGWSHRVLDTDVYDSHDYSQSATELAARHGRTADGEVVVNEPGSVVSVPYRGQPYFVSEFGGIWWNPDLKVEADSWGYGERVRNIEEWYARFEALCAVLLDNPAMFGYCYTQLTDVYQEQNGIYRFDRSEKFDIARVRAAQVRPAAVELGVDNQR